VLRVMAAAPRGMLPHGFGKREEQLPWKKGVARKSPDTREGPPLRDLPPRKRYRREPFVLEEINSMEKAGRSDFFVRENTVVTEEG